MYWENKKGMSQFSKQHLEKNNPELEMQRFSNQHFHNTLAYFHKTFDLAIQGPN